MPIFGLTDRQESFLRLAKIKKGEKDPETGAPRDLDYFRLTYSFGCEDIEKAFREIYGDKPTRINIRLAFPEISKVWDAYYVCYETGGRLAQAGSDENGLYWVWYRDHETKEVLVRNGRPIGPNGEEFVRKKIDITQPIYSYPEKKKGVPTGKMVPVYLEPEGRLSVVIPELAWVEGKPRVGYFDFCPTSPRDIGTISGELAGIELWAKRVGKDLTGIPMVLTRRKEMITKNINGVLSQGPSWVVHIEMGGEWGGKALEFMQMKALPEVIDAEYTEIQPAEFVDEDHDFESPAIPEPSEKKVEETKKVDPNVRPYAPEVFREKFKAGVAAIAENYAKSGKACEATENNRSVLASILDTHCFSGKDAQLERHEFLFWLTGHDSTKDMSCEQVKALLHIMKVSGDKFGEVPDGVTVQEIKSCQTVIVNEK